MVTAKKFHEKTRSHQVLHILLQKGPLTVWELVDAFKARQVDVTDEAVSKALSRLREEGKAGICNWKDEERRQKRRRNGYYYGGYTNDNRLYGKKMGSFQSVPVWAAVNNGEEHADDDTDDIG